MFLFESSPVLRISSMRGSLSWPLFSLHRWQWCWQWRRQCSWEWRKCQRSRSAVWITLRLHSDVFWLSVWTTEGKGLPLTYCLLSCTFFNPSQIKGGREQHQELEGDMPEGEPGVVMRRMRMMKMGQGELGIAGTETVEDGDEQLEMRAVILMQTLQKPGRTRQIRNLRKMVKKRKMRKGVKVGKAKMRRNRTKSLIRKGKKRRPTRRKKTKRNQDLGNSVNYFF